MIRIELEDGGMLTQRVGFNESPMPGRAELLMLKIEIAGGGESFVLHLA